MNIIDTILSRREFSDNPPVLLDIGASGEIHPKWRRIARYSVCIVFDADQREMGYTVKESSGYRKLYVYNSIVAAEEQNEADFYLTKSPFCSSLLPPDRQSLEDWAFAGLFEVERTVRLKTTTLPQVLNDIGIDKIDWFKTDSQGTDLRLFNSLGEERINRVLVAEFEPGIIDSYRGEDKLWSLMAYMEKKPFWMTALDIIGSQRISPKNTAHRFSPLQNTFMHVLLKRSPGWGEVSYLNTFKGDPSYLHKRDYLLGWVFSTVEGQHGFALEIAHEGIRRFSDSIFNEMENFSFSKIRRGYARLPIFLVKKYFNKFFGGSA
jgi:hypothetical protein